jgi:hypothetical protein
MVAASFTCDRYRTASTHSAWKAAANDYLDDRIGLIYADRIEDLVEAGVVESALGQCTAVQEPIRVTKALLLKPPEKFRHWSLLSSKRTGIG